MMAKAVTAARQPDAEAGADPRPADRWGGTPLTDSEANGHGEIAALLRQQAEGPVPLLESGKREAAAV